MLLLALVLSLLIGLSLGLLGGGGSILTVPILVYALGVEPKEAIATSLLVVGAISAFSSIQHAWRGSVRWIIALQFGAAGVVGAYLGGLAADFFSGAVLLLLFAAMMLATGVAMLRKRKRVDGASASGEHRKHPWWLAILEGLIVGAATGLVGAGGGFLVVPALVLLGGLGMREAIGTSLVVISVKSFAGYAGHATHVQVDWQLAGIVTAAAVVGSIGGALLAHRVPQAALRKIFGVFVLVMAAFLLFQELPGVLTEGSSPDAEVPVEGAHGRRDDAPLRADPTWASIEEKGSAQPPEGPTWRVRS